MTGGDVRFRLKRGGYGLIGYRCPGGPSERFFATGFRCSSRSAEKAKIIEEV